MTTTTTLKRCIVALGLGYVVTHAFACQVAEDPTDPILSERQLQELAELGIADAAPVDGVIVLLADDGRELGAMTDDGPRVEVELDGERALLLRTGRQLVVHCSSMAEQRDIGAPSELSAWLNAADVEPGCVRALRIAQVISAIDDGHAEGCAVVDTADGRRLDCSAAETSTAEDEAEFRLLDAGGCGCQGDDWGFCPAECWNCWGDSGFYTDDPFCDGGGGGGGGGGGDGGGGGGGGEVCWGSRNFHADRSATAGNETSAQNAACTAAGNATVSACLQSATVCTPHAGSPTCQPYGCDQQANGQWSCWAGANVTCTYTFW